MRPSMIDTHRPARLLMAALAWLAIGSVLLLSTLVPVHTARLGWTPMFWLLGAPLSVVLTLQPKLLRFVFGWRRSRRRNEAHLIWN